MTERQMSAKGFLAKTNTRAAISASAFLAQYREWLTTGELAYLADPILAKVDCKELMPTPAVKLLAHATMCHIVECDRAKTEAILEKVQSGQEERAPKAWLGTVLDLHGNICTRINAKGEEEELVKEFDNASACERWVDRRLFDEASTSYGTIEHTSLNVYSRVERADSIARILKKPKGSTCRVKPTTTKTLGFTPKCVQDRASFSRG